MIVSFSGLEMQLNCPQGTVVVFEVQDKTMFAGICQSLSSGMREQAIEPYMLWDDAGNSLKMGDSPLVVGNVFNLPWADKALGGSLFGAIERELLGEEKVRQAIENLNQEIAAQFYELVLPLECDYGFDVEWTATRYLKACGFAPELLESERLIDNLEKFLSLASDVSFQRTLVFMNLKNFLSENDYRRFCDRVFFLNLSVLLIESVHESYIDDHEEKYRVDQQFIEY